MRSTLHIKFIALYIIFGFLCLFSTATLTEQLVTDKLTEDTSHTLYREATFVANDYLPSYFSGDSSIYNVQSQLSAMRLYFNASIWFVDSTGRTLTSSSLEDTVCPDRIKDFNPAEIGGKEYNITCCAVGNPHCVVFVDNVDKINIESVGPQFETAPIFPERVNTEFVRVVNSKTLKMRVWERGNGETQACGTGACAAVIAAVENGYCSKDEDITVKVKGGDLIVNYSDNGVTLTGDCNLVYKGEIEY